MIWHTSNTLIDTVCLYLMPWDAWYYYSSFLHCIFYVESDFDVPGNCRVGK